MDDNLNVGDVCVIVGLEHSGTECNIGKTVTLALLVPAYQWGYFQNIAIEGKAYPRWVVEGEDLKVAFVQFGIEGYRILPFTALGRQHLMKIRDADSEEHLVKETLIPDECLVD